MNIENKGRQDQAIARATLNELQPRYGEAMVIHTRSDRFFRKGQQWFFSTREGDNIGPFTDKSEAQLALVYFKERTQWPDKKQLRSYLRKRSSH